MEQPQIRYTKTSDGVNIAYCTIGSGQPIVYLSPMPMTHVELEWRVDDLRAAYERTARNNTWVRYDGRGFGLSDRDAPDFSLDAMVRDLDAVVNALGLPPFVIMSTAGTTTAALTYASQHPERVAAMILWEGMAAFDGVEFGFNDLVRTNFGLFKQLLAGLMGFETGSSTDQMLHLLDEAATQNNTVAFQDAQMTWDATDSLAQVTAPTLIVHRRGYQGGSGEASRRLAAALPNATFTTVEGSAASLTDAASRDAMRQFLQAHLPRPAASDPAVAPSAPLGMVVVLFTDIVDSTALTERLGDTVFRTASRTLDEGMRAAMHEAGGTPVDGKVLGDGVMGVFTSASQAIAAARRCIELSAESELQLHVGLHAGDVIHEKGNVYGGAVNIASRVCGLSAPGEVLVSGTVRELARTSAGVEFEDRGEQALKGIEDAVRVYEVGWRA
jgi:class 3 adenylate cyclase